MNQITVIGTLGKDPEMTYTEAGLAKTKFSVATNSGKDKAGKDRPADWHNVIVWGAAEGRDGLAGLCAQYLSKGKKVAIRGKHEVNEWEDKEGNKRRSCQIVAQEVEFLSPKDKGND
jgi:single-strand DNA-binding protein